MFGGSKLGGADGAGLPPPVGRSGSEIFATACDTSGSLKLPKSGGAGGGLGGGGGGGGGPPRLANGLEKPLALAALVAFARDGDGGDAVFANGLVKAGVDAAAFFAAGFFVLVVDDAPAPPNCERKREKCVSNMACERRACEVFFFLQLHSPLRKTDYSARAPICPFSA